MKIETMKIFQVIPQLSEGGAERFVIDLCNALIDNHPCQISLIVFFNIDKNHVLVRDLDPRIEIIELNKKFGFDYSIFGKLDRLVKKHKPQVIHTHLNAFEYMSYVIFKYKKGINFINTIHNSPEWMYSDWKKRSINALLYRLHRVTPVIISSDSIPEFKKLFSSSTATLIFNGRPMVAMSPAIQSVQAEVSSYKKSPRTKVFINLARISPQKNQVMLVEAFNTLIEKGEDIVLLIVGTPWDQELLAKLKSKIKDRIHLLGYKNNPSDYLSGCDAFCLSSFNEGMPISLIEAIQLGIIPICTPAGGVKDIITASIGYITPDFSKESYIKTIKEFLMLSDIQREEMSKNAKLSYSQAFAMNITAKNYYKLYEQ